jgi:hypothetical protein
MRPHREVTNVSAVRAKNLTYLAIDVGGILSGVFDEANPLRAVGSLVKLAEKVGGLHDGFNRIAQIMRQAAEPTDDFGRELLRVDHGLFPDASDLRRLYVLCRDSAVMWRGLLPAAFRDLCTL